MSGGKAAHILRSRRYALASAGPILVSIAHFCTSFSMLRLEDPHSFGTFTILFAAAIFSGSLASALFGAPVQTLPESEPDARIETTDAISTAALAAAALAFPAAVLLATILEIEAAPAICYGLFVSLTILRQYGRAWTYTVARPKRVAASDAYYGGVLLTALSTAIFIFHERPVHAVFAALALAALAALMGLGSGFSRLLASARLSKLSRFKQIWNGQSRWSLAAVVAAETASNAHIYLLTAFVGAAAVAPIAASALLIRPIIVVQGALMEYERPQFVKHIHSGQCRELDRTILWMRSSLVLVWVGTITVGAGILFYLPGLVFPSEYDLSNVALAAALWALLQFVIVAQVPEIVLMQSFNHYLFLARANVWAGTVNLLGVLAVIGLGKPVWTVAALIPGWIMVMAMLRYRSKQVGTGSLVRRQD